MISYLYTGGYEIDPAHGLPQPLSDITSVDKSEPSPILSRGDGDDIFETLLSHLRVNAIADYFNIQNLVGYANSNILLILQSCEAPGIFLHFAQEVSRSTGDTALHSILESTLANCLEDLTDLDFKDVELGSTLVVGVLRASGTRIRELQAQISTLQSVTATESLRNARIITNIDNCVKMAKRTKECRNCNTEFANYIEKHGKEHEPTYTLRCEKCRCRHRPD